MDGSMGWGDVWRAHDMLDLQEWAEWEQYVRAEGAQRAGSR